MKCSSHISPLWVLGDVTMREFFDRLAESIFHPSVLYGDGPPEWFESFRTHCENRELAGRKRFGFSHLARDNAREAQEEAADLAIYSLCSLLSEKRAGEDEEWALALTAAYHAAEAHRYSGLLRKHRHQAFSDADQSEPAPEEPSGAVPAGISDQSP